MAEILFFHHALGLTPGCLAFADELRAAGHAVHTPDLYDGATFARVEEGVAHAESVGFGTIVERGRQSAEALPEKLVYAGMSLGVMPAQSLAQNRPGAVGAVLLHSTVAPEDVGGSWPPGLPAQIHTMTDDEWGDVDVAQSFADAVESVELFRYPGSGHLFTDRGTADYDESAATLVMRRVLGFLAELP